MHKWNEKLLFFTLYCLFQHLYRILHSIVRKFSQYVPKFIPLVNEITQKARKLLRKHFKSCVFFWKHCATACRDKYQLCPKANCECFFRRTRRNSSLLKINISEQKETTVRHREGKTQGQPLSPASRRSIRSPWDFREQQTVSLNRVDFSCMSHHSGILNEVCLHGCTLSKSHK